MPRTGRARLASLAALLLAAGPAAAQVAYPRKPATYEAHFRYRIRADRDERIRQFRSMERFLKSIGFVPRDREDADLEAFDPTAERMDGTIPSANAARLLEEPHILTTLLVPAGTKLPEDPAKPVQVRISLSPGLAPRERRLLHEQVARHLTLMGFKEGIAYDTDGDRILRGSLPAGYLFTLLKDLRYQPSGWFAPLVSPETLPTPLRNTLPIRQVEVLPDLPAAPAVPAPAPPAETAPAPAGASPGHAKFTPDLAAALADPAAAGQPIRVELILQDDPTPYPQVWRDLRFRIRTAAEGVSVDGLVGVVVSVRVPRGSDVALLAELPEVRSVRLPRPGTETAAPFADDPVKVPELLAKTRLADLHRLGFRGQGTRIAVVASDFPRALELIGNRLPKTTRVIDLTAELNADLIPNPAEPGRLGVGTAIALAAHATAPDAQIVLVRVDPAAFHELLTVARAVSGDPTYSEAMQSRSAELIARSEQLTVRRTRVLDEYRQAYSTLSDEPGPAKRRAEARAALEQLLADERVFKATVDRFAALKAALDGLRGTAVVVGTLDWQAGYPQDGTSELAKYLEARFAPRPVRSALRASQEPPVPTWVQGAGTAVGQVWAGPFRDADAEGSMEFAPPEAGIPANRWTQELNFLGTPQGDTLPGGLKLRFTIQWREPHDPEGFAPRDAIFPLNLRLLRQVDPTGKTVASDEMLEVGYSASAPVRLAQTVGSATFEQTLDVTLPADGVYALRVEGRRAFAYQLPALERAGEIPVRIVIEPSGPAAAKARPVFRTFPTPAGGVGVPADSRAALTVGVLGKGGRPAGTLTGAGPGVQLLAKPDLLMPGSFRDEGFVASGPGVAAGFAGGAAASLRSAGVRAGDLAKQLGLQPGTTLELPEWWLRSFTHRGGGATER